MPYRDDRRACVSCGAELRLVRSGGFEFERCGPCGGVFVRFEVFRAMLASAQPAHPIDELLVHNDGTQRRRCPVCGGMMDISWLEFLQLDQCADHGVWFDGGELEKALDYDVGIVELRQLEARIQEKRPPDDRPSRSGGLAKWLAARFRSS